MAKLFVTDEDVEQEIDRLVNSDDVKLARKHMYLQNKRRQRMYQLRNFEKTGKKLREQGITMDVLEAMETAMSREEAEEERVNEEYGY
ncbi:MAG: hypothetical protein Q4B22_06705 [Eubacteriales bacterium]|nr:hypothetical protein [Eubacteriales bacterium]